MNMISTGAFQTEMNASNKQPTLANKFAAVWEKKNAKAARAGGVSLMALSLAACGSDDATTTTASTATTTTTTTTTTVTPVSTALTIAADTVTGTTGNDTFTASRNDTIQTWNSGDVIAGGDGTDSLTAVLDGAVTPAVGAVTGIENVSVTGIGAIAIDFSSATASFITGVTSLTSTGSDNTMAFNDMTGIAEMTVNNSAAAHTFSYNDAILAGAADAGVLNLNGAGAIVNVGTNSDDDGGFETLTINATGAASDMGAGHGLGEAATTITVNATVGMDFGTTAGFGAATLFDGSNSSGAITAVFEDFDVADAVTPTNTTAKTIKTGSGADAITISAMEIADVGVFTIELGAGNDTITANTTVASDIAIDGGAGSDTLVITAALTSTTATNISNMEVISLDGDINQNLAVLSAAAGNGITNVILDGDGAITNANDTVTTVTIRAAHDGASSLARTVDGSANSVTFVINEATASATSMTANDEESITINAQNAYSMSTGLTSADMTSLTVLGDSTVDVSAAAAAKLATIDASGLTAAAQYIMSSTTSAVDMTVTGNTASSGYTGLLNIVTGTGNDTVTGTANADIVNGGAGTDTINAGAGADQITGGTGADTIDLGADEAADDVFITSNTSTDTITGFDTAEDDADFNNMNVAVNATVAVATAAQDGDAVFVDNNAFVFDDGTDVHGAGTVAASIASYTTLADVALYISTAIDSDLHGGADTNTAAGDQAIFVINDLIGNKTYAYHFLEGDGVTDVSAGAAVTAGEIALVAIITEESGAALVAGDVI
jgi:hypothetical protein